MRIVSLLKLYMTDKQLRKLQEMEEYEIIGQSLAIIGKSKEHHGLHS